MSKDDTYEGHRRTSIEGLGRDTLHRTMYQKSHKLISLNAQKVRNEIAVLKKVSMGHQNILTLVDYFETMNNRTPAPLYPTHARENPKKVIANPSVPTPSLLISIPRHGPSPWRRAL